VNFCLFDLLQVSVVDDLGIPVKFVGVGEGMEDLQPFDAEAFVEAIFP
jgi:fused signal recognition particle receptor